MPKDALFRIASMTKPITALGILILADEGKLSIEDPVEKHLAGVSWPNVGSRPQRGHHDLEETNAPDYLARSADAHVGAAESPARGARRPVRQTEPHPGRSGDGGLPETARIRAGIKMGLLQSRHRYPGTGSSKSYPTSPTRISSENGSSNRSGMVDTNFLPAFPSGASAASKHLVPTVYAKNKPVS